MSKNFSHFHIFLSNLCCVRNVLFLKCYRKLVESSFTLYAVIICKLFNSEAGHLNPQYISCFENTSFEKYEIGFCFNMRGCSTTSSVVEFDICSTCQKCPLSFNLKVHYCVVNPCQLLPSKYSRIHFNTNA